MNYDGMPMSYPGPDGKPSSPSPKRKAWNIR